MPLECYFSHSWASQDVALNVIVWETIANACELYVDAEGAETGAYYINRLEELIRKSNVFVSVLAYRVRGHDNPGGRPDYQLSCSAAALFEVRLAERARKPRWVIYDDRTGFVPPAATSDLVVYTPIATAEELQRNGTTLRSEGHQWLQRVGQALRSANPPRNRRAALLIDDRCQDADEVAAATSLALRRAGYAHVSTIAPVHTDAEMVATLQSSSLLVAEVGAESLREVYGMAHAMFIPTIRFIRSSLAARDLPRLLEGHPGGYQHDLVLGEELAALATEVEKRAEAMRDSRRPITSLSAGCAYLRRRLYRNHRVFFSHNLPAADNDLLKQVFAALDRLGVRAWEYRHNNRAGVVWQEELQLALSEATDVVFILGHEFELSPACVQELDSLLSRRGQLKSLTPFLWGGRERPTPALATLHAESLPNEKQSAARIIVDRLIPLLAAVPAPASPAADG